MEHWDNGSAAIFISLLGMSIEDLFVSRFLNKLETWVSVTLSITKLLIEDDEIYCVGFSLLLSILLAKFGPTLIKCLLHWSAISSLLVYILLFLAFLRGVVCLFVFVFICCWFLERFLFGACFSTINSVASIVRAVTSCKTLHCSVIAFQSIVWISWRYDSVKFIYCSL